MLPHIRSLTLPLILLVVMGFGTWHLSESPTIWGDEGMLIELAVNVVRHGAMRTQLAPNEFISAATMTTGFPVIYPVAASFKVFGIGLLQARAVMVGYLLLCIAAFFLLAKRIVGLKNATYATLLVATFPPFYGNGKNVLGEVPGLFFFFLFLLCVHCIETSERLRRWLYVCAGLTSGLCLVTKPTFLTLLPAIIGAAILLRKKLRSSDLASLVLFVAGFIAPVLIWLLTQFLPGDSVHNILSFYSNPYQLTDVRGTIIENILRFFKELSPLYLLGLFSLWSISFLSRLWQDLRTKPRPHVITFTETISYVFTGLILIAYLRTPGWHRYFFPAQIIVFMYVPSSLCTVFEGVGRLASQVLRRANPVRLLSWSAYVILASLIIFQAYQVAFNSWIAVSYYSTFTRELTTYFKTFDPSKSVFTPPELIIFLPTDNYYQYVDTNGFTFGEKELIKLSQGIPDVLILAEHYWDTRIQEFPLYQEKIRVARYVVAERRNASR